MQGTGVERVANASKSTWAVSILLVFVVAFVLSVLIFCLGNISYNKITELLHGPSLADRCVYMRVFKHVWLMISVCILENYFYYKSNRALFLCLH